MDWSDSRQQAAFRVEARALIESRLPARYRAMAASDAPTEEQPWQVDRISEDPAHRAAAEEWRVALAEKGWVAPHWPPEYGGAGLSSMEQFIFSQEIARAGAPRVGGTGVGILGPALIVHGSEEQKREHLPKILAGERVWAQGFSEPGAGSDLASLQTRAVRDGDEWVINGQKIWTTLAHTVDWLFALVRTDPEAPKHRGISFLMMDKATPGITVRPLINAAFRHNFNETFFEDVRVPASHLVGEENRGWYVAMTLMDFERSNVGGAITFERAVRRLVEYATHEGRDRSRLDRLDALRQLVTGHLIEAHVQLNFSLRIVSMQARGEVPNHEASTNKLFGSEASQRLTNTATKLFGLYANLWDQDDPRSPMQGSVAQEYCNSIQNTIAAGTSEIQRNVIATRGLGLPRA